MQNPVNSLSFKHYSSTEREYLSRPTRIEEWARGRNSAGVRVVLFTDAECARVVAMVGIFEQCSWLDAVEFAPTNRTGALECVEELCAKYNDKTRRDFD